MTRRITDHVYPPKAHGSFNSLGGPAKPFLYQSCKRQAKKIFIQGHPMSLEELGVPATSQSTCLLIRVVSPLGLLGW